MKKIFIITICLVPLCLIAFFIYFVTGVSYTSPPIRQYEYLGTTNQLIDGFRKYASTNSDVAFKITDTTGSKKFGYAIYMRIETKNIEYHLKCKEQYADGNLSKITISLGSAIDKARNIGYSKGAKGIDAIVDNFDSNVLKPLKNNQHIQINPL